jgi:tetratricopeptide (TPR) repeat protein
VTGKREKGKGKAQPADLQTRLQAAVGETYRVEKELGGGGMSRVFLAEEVRLGRKVVIKLLPPEMAAGVNVERFEREIQLAARLQHPHVVPLLTAGASGDLLYYIMPFIQGESLRARLAKQGELPVGDAVRILKEVADALAYAHRNGVVHRDIKPDNVLLSEGHAVVTDFGVAKAVSASTGASSLTSLGVALGTPAYMAPEQAVADPNVDHRADIYALGAMAYEMLCGRPPFSGPNAQAVLSMHVTEAPEPATKHRTTVPDALNALIMRCLEKKAADRWQKADELIPHLDALLTPTGGITPTATQPVRAATAAAAPVGSGATALAKAHPLRVVALFGLASIGVLAIVYAIVRVVGLPYWVLYGAIVLLAIGLPIMLLTGRRERQRAIATMTGVQYTTPVGLERHFTWRKAIWGGGLAFAGLAVVSGGYMAMRLLGIGPVGTLLASGALKERQPVLLAEFVNRTTDSTLGPTLTEAFRVDLAQSRSVELVDPQQVSDVLRRMQRPADTRLTPDVAREVAERGGVTAVVTGQIDPVATSYVLSASVVSAGDGRVLTAVRATAADGAHLIGALDALSRDLRERIGESLVTIRKSQPLAQVTTGSLDALRRYSEASSLEDHGDYEGAASLYRQAVQLDSGFAMAYRKLAVVLGNSGASFDEVVKASTRAYRLRDRLPPVERGLATAYYYYNVDYDHQQIMAAYRSVLEADPGNEAALNNLSLELIQDRQWSAAESLLTRGIALGYHGVFFANAVRAQIFQGHYAAAKATADRWAQASPGDPDIFGVRALLAAAQHDYPAAEQFARQLRDQQKASPRWRQNADGILANLSEAEGKLQQAEQYRRDAMAAADARGLPGQFLTEAARAAVIDARYRDRPQSALSRIEDALRTHPLSSISPADRPYSWLASAYALAKKPDEARRLMTDYARSTPEGIRRGDFGVDAAEGDIASAEGRWKDAIAAYQKWNDESGCTPCGLYERAVAYDRLGQEDSTTALLERLATVAAPGRLGSADYALAPAYKRLGELYEQKGNREKAMEYYSKFLDQWKDADPELQPVVQDVKRRLAGLVGERR